MGLEPATAVVGEPARSLCKGFSKAQGAINGESELETTARRHEKRRCEAQTQQLGQENNKMDSDVPSIIEARLSTTDCKNSSPAQLVVLN